MHGRSLFAQHTVALALVFMVAHQAAHSGEGVIFKQGAPCLVQPALLQHRDDLRDGRMDGAPFLALGRLTVQTAVGFVQHMDRHGVSPFPLKLVKCLSDIDICFTLWIFRSFSIVLKKPQMQAKCCVSARSLYKSCPAAAVIFGSRIPQRLTLHVPHSRFVKQMMRPASAKPARR